MATKSESGVQVNGDLLLRVVNIETWQVSKKIKLVVCLLSPLSWGEEAADLDFPPSPWESKPTKAPSYSFPSRRNSTHRVGVGTGVGRGGEGAGVTQTNVGSQGRSHFHRERGVLGCYNMDHEIQKNWYLFRSFKFFLHENENTGSISIWVFLALTEK